MTQTKHLLLLAALLHCIATNAHDFEADGIYYNIISFTEETVEVTYQGEQYDSYDEYNGTVIIPETVAPYRVIKIGANAFRGCDNLTSVTIPEGVTSIGEGTFDDCSNLTSLNSINSLCFIVDVKLDNYVIVALNGGGSGLICCENRERNRSEDHCYHNDSKHQGKNFSHDFYPIYLSV